MRKILAAARNLSYPGWPVLQSAHKPSSCSASCSHLSLHSDLKSQSACPSRGMPAKMVSPSHSSSSEASSRTALSQATGATLPSYAPVCIANRIFSRLSSALAAKGFAC